MKKYYNLTISFVCCFLFCFTAFAQQTIKGVVFDNQTLEPLAGATVSIPNTTTGTQTNEKGQFVLQASTEKILISFIGYESQEIVVEGASLKVALAPMVGNLQTVVVTANREAGLRTQSPVAISKLSPTLINDTKPTNLYEIINKVPGVVMLNYNNEQHAMSIRQPMTTNSYFLYMEDGIPVRPMGVFNHNALIEMNMMAISSVEIVKGPASSLYGPEAVGGALNFITQRPTAIPTARAGIQFDDYGYKRFQYSAGATAGRFGFFLGGYLARQTNSWMDQSDFEKSSVNARAEYKLADKTNLTGTFTYNDYYSETGGTVDSTAFYSRSYKSNNDFTYRAANAIRARLSLEHTWNTQATTTITSYFRDNSLKQNPNYSIIWTAGSTTATGQINENAFTSYGVVAQHSQRFDFLQSKLLVGGMYDYSKNPYYAYTTQLAAQLRADGKSVEKYTLTQELPNDYLSRYKADIYNSALFTQWDFELIQKLRISLGARYDRIAFDYVNYLDNNATGSKSYSQFTLKLGLTYDLGKDKGLYANYSKGFSPPALTAIFRKNTNATESQDLFYYNLKPARFDNFEIGGWAAFFQNKVYLDWAVYQMNGYNELLSIRQSNNSYDYQSAGKTLHRGIEYGLTWKPTTEWFFRFGGTNALHKFIEFELSQRETDQVKNINDKVMPQSPSWTANTEVTYKPNWLRGFRASLEWQRMSSWYMNQVNTVKYDDHTALGLKGISLFNFRTGYTWKGVEVFVNVMNLTNELYANSTSLGNGASDRATYTAGAPRTFVMGIQYNFTGKK
ncbi:TonB-dependent receptor [Xanthocytophaga agilis]|uniref:TonB-dependent receptor n=1 Tax=Xanthocytophaga agilis TaxID=3048010 RepID=A0AAE3RCU3_9BACT|nr:TonB-dependent receptor [Xanthocytophaga agilis]MDJ1506172.1 TonB-dependent receptor [Xanthocytophaga agilis]